MGKLEITKCDIKLGREKKITNVFTEHGVLMLSSVLNSAKAIAVNIQVIRIFTRLREMLLSHQDVLLKLEQLDKKIVNMGFDVKMHDGEIETIFEMIKEIMAEKAKPQLPIGFKTRPDKNK